MALAYGNIRKIGHVWKSVSADQKLYLPRSHGHAACVHTMHSPETGARQQETGICRHSEILMLLFSSTSEFPLILAAAYVTGSINIAQSHGVCSALWILSFVGLRLRPVSRYVISEALRFLCPKHSQRKTILVGYGKQLMLHLLSCFGSVILKSRKGGFVLLQLSYLQNWIEFKFLLIKFLKQTLAMDRL